MKFIRLRELALLGTLLLLGQGLNGCSSSAPSSGTQDTIAATPSQAGTVTVVNGGSKSFTLSFNSSDKNAISNLSVTSGLAALPGGWSGPSAFHCATVSSGSGCVLTLTYAPTAAASGTVTIAYSYVNSAGVSQTGTASIPYAATVHDTVSATAAPTGQITAAAGASQAVALTFTTDDGNSATALTLTTSLTGLPAGWTSSTHSFTCATVSTGSGCLLPLTFAPTVVGGGTLTLSYSYTDNAGSVKTGAVNLAYAATDTNNLVGTAAPSGQINAVIGGAGQAVAVTFTTDDQNVTTALALTTDLGALPSGWSASGSSFTCASVGTGNGCQLHLTYAPSAAGGGTLTLNYGYHDTAGTAKTGSLNIAYAATAQNAIVGTAAPSGQVNAVVGSGSQSVAVNFATNAGVAGGFSLTTALNALPAGWTSTAASLTCASVSTSGSTCQLPLSYAPSTVGSGTLTLNYGYTNNAGLAAAGTVSIPYASTAHDTVSGAISPAGTLGVAVNATQSVTVTFTTSDGNVAGGLAIASSGSGGLGSLPAGWSVTGGATSFACSSISTGAGCALGLTYAPTAAASGSLALNFSYVDNAGTAQNGTVDIAYIATAQHAYVSDNQNGVYICSITGTTGALTGCQTTGGGFSGAWSVAFFSGSTANYAYVVDGQRANVYLCTVNDDGTLSTSCTNQTNQNAAFSYPEQLTVVGASLYVADQATLSGGEVTQCAINAVDGTLSNCSASGSGGDLIYASGVTLDGSFAYVATDNNGLYICGVDSTDGSLTTCTAATTSGSSVGNTWTLAVSGAVAYIAGESGFGTCTIGSAGVLSACSNTSLDSSSPLATGIALNGSFAYLSTESFMFGAGNVYLCSVNGLTVSACGVAVSDGSNSGFSRSITDVTIH
jgi:uncharacterized protein YbdZ (MbtH family)